MDHLQVQNFRAIIYSKKNIEMYLMFTFLLHFYLVLDGKDSEDSSSGPIPLAATEDSSEGTNDSLSVVINSEETSREPATNGNGNDTTNDNTNDNTNDTTTEDNATAPTNGGTATALVVEDVVGGGDDNAVADQEELEPTSKKIRLHETAEEGTA